MSVPAEMTRRVTQLRHDVDDVYKLLDDTNQTLSVVAATQRRHGIRLEEIQQSLDVTVGRLDRLEQAQKGMSERQESMATELRRMAERQDSMAERQDSMAERQDSMAERQNSMATELRRMAEVQQEQGTKLDSILTLLRDDRSAGRD